MAEHYPEGKEGEMSRNCRHIWRTDTDPPEFQMNRQMSPEPIIHVTCELCNARTWFTERQWCDDEWDEVET